MSDEDEEQEGGMRLTFNFGGSDVESEEEGAENKSADISERDSDDEEDDLWEAKFQDTIQRVALTGNASKIEYIVTDDDEDKFETVYMYLSKYGDDYYFKTYTLLDFVLPDNLFSEDNVALHYPLDADSLYQLQPLCSTVDLMCTHLASASDNKIMVICPDALTAAFVTGCVLLQQKELNTSEQVWELAPQHAKFINDEKTHAHDRYLGYFQQYLKSSYYGKKAFAPFANPSAHATILLGFKLSHAPDCGGDLSPLFKVLDSKDETKTLYKIGGAQKVPANGEVSLASHFPAEQADIHIVCVDSTTNRNIFTMHFHTHFLDPSMKQVVFKKKDLDLEESGGDGLMLVPEDMTLTVSYSVNLSSNEADNKSLIPLQQQSFTGIRSLVSKKKFRFQQDGYDLDLSYILPTIIAMGFPSSKLEGLYRNKMGDVQRFFKQFHHDHFKVYNLCSERTYSMDKFGYSCAYYPFHDHNPPPFELIPDFCKDCEEYLNANKKNTVAIHCKAGKGRTGTLISILLLYLRNTKTAKEALELFGVARTSNGKGVTIPSQQRYVRYSETWLNKYLWVGKPHPKDTALKITSIGLSCGLMRTTHPNFSIYRYEGLQLVQLCNDNFQGGKYAKKSKQAVDARLNCVVTNDVLIKINDDHDKLCAFWLNTNFIDRGPDGTKVFSVRLTKNELDSAVKDTKHKIFPADFSVVIRFEVPSEQEVTEAAENNAKVEVKEEKKGFSLADKVRGLVSKKKLRFQQDGFDLDLSYVQPRMIAMGFPSESFEGLYRNNMSDVQRFFDKYHPMKAKIYNLCSERSYDPAKFAEVSHAYPFDDHNPPAFEIIEPFCQDVDSWLHADKENVIAVHCKAGKGRTGTLLACYFIHSDTSPNSTEALQLFGDMRTANGKGVTIPSQQRYVHYYGTYLNEYVAPKITFPTSTKLVITGLKLHRLIDGNNGGTLPYFLLTQRGKADYDWKGSTGQTVPAFRQTSTHTLPCKVTVENDFKIILYDADGDEKLLWFWLHAAFLERTMHQDADAGVLRLGKNELDGAIKDKNHRVFPEDFHIEVNFRRFHESDGEQQVGQTGLVEAAKSTSEKKRRDSLEEVKNEKNTRNVGNIVRQLVSKKKRRYQQDGFDLDLSYVTQNIIAMGLPSESVAGLYRNQMVDVQRFFKTYHDNSFRVYNLCSEHEYPASKFGGNAVRFPFHDHNPPELGLIPRLCEDVDLFLSEDDTNVAAIHCKAGKGRTGLVIACLLLFLQHDGTGNAQEALQYFARKRTLDDKGVTIPSQQRYVEYFARYLSEYRWKDRAFSFKGPQITISMFRLTTAPIGGAFPYFAVANYKGSIYNQKKDKTSGPIKEFKKAAFLDISCSVKVEGDFKVTFYNKKDDSKMFWFWLHTTMLTMDGKSSIVLNKKQLDHAIKDKKHEKFDEALTVEMFYEYAETDVSNAMKRSDGMRRKEALLDSGGNDAADEALAVLQQSDQAGDDDEILERDDDGAGPRRMTNLKEKSRLEAIKEQNRVVIAGTLSKKSGSMLGGWQDRYFVLTGRQLQWYKKEADYKDGSCEPLGSIRTTMMRDIQTKHDDLAKLDISLIASKDHKNKEAIRLRADSKETAAEWLKSIRGLMTERAEQLTGFLRKKSPKSIGGMVSWQRRYFVLNRQNRVLAYYRTQNTSVEPLGVIDLRDVEFVSVFEHMDKTVKQSTKEKHRFQIVLNELANNRSFTLWADSAFLAAEWIKAIRQCCDIKQ